MWAPSFFFSPIADLSFCLSLPACKCPLIHPIFCLLMSLLLSLCSLACECSFVLFNACWPLFYSIAVHQDVSAATCPVYCPLTSLCLHFLGCEYCPLVCLICWLLTSVSAYQSVSCYCLSYSFCWPLLLCITSLWVLPLIQTWMWVSPCVSHSLSADTSIALSLLNSLWVLTPTHPVTACWPVALSLLNSLWGHLLFVPFTACWPLSCSIFYLPACECHPLFIFFTAC